MNFIKKWFTHTRIHNSKLFWSITVLMICFSVFMVILIPVVVLIIVLATRAQKAQKAQEAQSDKSIVRGRKTKSPQSIRLGQDMYTTRGICDDDHWPYPHEKFSDENINIIAHNVFKQVYRNEYAKLTDDEQEGLVTINTNGNKTEVRYNIVGSYKNDNAILARFNSILVPHGYMASYKENNVYELLFEEGYTCFSRKWKREDYEKHLEIGKIPKFTGLVLELHNLSVIAEKHELGLEVEEEIVQWD